MFAVVEIAGKQYRVEPKEKIKVDLLQSEPGETVKFERVVLVAETEESATIGKPYVAGAFVEAKVLGHEKGEKIRVFKFVAKKRQKKLQGHRQNYTLLEVTDVKK